MSARDFLVEIGTEELPPKALTSLSKAFSTEILTSLKQLQLGFADAESFATPRRLALLVKGLDESQADKTIERFGPAVQAAFDKDGNATPPRRALRSPAASKSISSSAQKKTASKNSITVRRNRVSLLRHF